MMSILNQLGWLHTGFTGLRQVRQSARLILERLEERTLLNGVTWFVDAADLNAAIQNGSVAHPYGTIQQGIDAADPGGGDIVKVAAGTYPENVTIGKSVTLAGAQAGNAASARFALFTLGANGPKANQGVETILTAPAVNPTGANPGANDLIRVLADNITIDGLVLDGNNPALAASAVKVGAINIDARRGITNIDASDDANPVNNLLIENNIIQNVAQRGISLANDGPATTGNLITGNVIRNFGSDPDEGGSGIILLTNAYADIQNNTIADMVAGQNGLEMDDFSIDGSMTWSGNDVMVAQDGVGILVDTFAASAGVLNLNDNVIHAAAGVTGADDLTWGMYIVSVKVGSTVTLSGNSIGASGGQFARGIDLTDSPTSSPVTISGGTIANCLVGVNLESVDPFNGAGSATTLAVNHLTITTSTIGVRVQAAPVTQFDSGLDANPTASVAMILSGLQVSGAKTGLLVHGFNSTVTATATLTGSTLDHNKTGILIQTGGNLTAATSNHITHNTSYGVRVTAGSATLHSNRIVGNAVGVNSNSAKSNVDANDNWWGSNAGRNGIGSDTATKTNSGKLSAATWLVLRISVAPSLLNPGDTATVTADLTHNNHNIAVADALPATPAHFTAAVGTITPQDTNLSDGMATVSYTAATSAKAKVSVKVDRQKISTLVRTFPVVTSIQLMHPGFVQSQVSGISIMFSRPVSLSAGAITLVQDGTGTTPVLRVTKATNGLSYMVTFSGPGVNAGLLDAGSWVLTVHHDLVHDSTGLTPTDDGTLNFTV